MTKKLFTRDQFAEPDDDAGIFIEGLGRALETWAAMNYPERTVADAMAAFNTTREVIIEAVNDAQWAYLSDDNCDDPAKTTIELDGA